MNGILMSLYSVAWVSLLAQSSTLELPFAKEILSLGSTGVMIGLLIWLLIREKAEIAKERQQNWEQRERFIEAISRLEDRLEQVAEAEREKANG